MKLYTVIFRKVSDRNGCWVFDMQQRPNIDDFMVALQHEHDYYTDNGIDCENCVCMTEIKDHLMQTQDYGTEKEYYFGGHPKCNGTLVSVFVNEINKASDLNLNFMDIRT